VFDQTMVGCAVVIALVMGGPARVLAQETKTAAAPSTLTEADVIRLSAVAEPALRVAQARVAQAQADAFAATLLDNPTLQWQRDALVGSAGEAEDGLSISVPLDLSGRRSARQALSRSRAELGRAEVRLTRGAAAARALRAYHAAVAARQRVAIAQRAVQRLDEAARVLAARHREGSVSGYDRLRLELELELSRSRVQQAAAQERVARGTLGALLGTDVQPAQLPLQLASDPAVAPGDAVQPRPSAQRMQQAMSALTDADRASESAWVPRIKLRGGLLLATADDTQLGYIAGIAVELPLLQSGQELPREVGAQRAEVRERIAADAYTAEVDARGASLQLEAARAELSRLKAAVADRLDRLDAGALASYREGVRGLTELLDAQRTRTEVELHMLALHHAAKRAEVALRAARGELQ